MKVAFLDRDGTMVEDYEDEHWRNVTEPSFLPGTIEALQRLTQKRYHLIIITNQYLIGEGIITQSQYDRFTEKMCTTLSWHGVKISDIFYCPDSRIKNSYNLKPNPGMIEAVLNKYPEIDLTQSFLVGDSECDITLANRIGLKAFGIGFKADRTDCIPVASLREVSESV